MKRMIMCCVASLAVAASTLIGASTASGQPVLPTPGSAHSTAAFPNCAQRLEPNGGQPGPLQCFATLSNAMAVATGNTAFIGLSNDQAINAASHLSAAASPNTSYMIGTDWWDADFNHGCGGAGCPPTYSYYAGVTCGTNGDTFFNNTMPSGWNDKVSSARSWPYSHCNHYYHYENTYLNQYKQGAVIDCAFCSSMGVMNDQTSSEKWTQ